MNRADQKLATFVRFAIDLESLSTCKRRQVGCVIMPLDMTCIYAIGYNGQPARVSHDECNANEGACGCIHAEMNAIAKLRIVGEHNLFIITTLSPCKLCAGLIINTRLIRQVWYVNEYRDTSGITLLKSAGLHVNQVPKQWYSSSVGR